MSPAGLLDRLASRALIVVAALAALEAMRADGGGRRLPLSLVAAIVTGLGALAIARRLRPGLVLPTLPGRLACLVVVALPALVTVCFYRDVLDAWFLADDLFFAKSYAATGLLAGIRSDLLPGLGTAASDVQVLRPVSQGLTRLILHTAGAAPWIMHAVNVVLHAATAALLAWFALRVTGVTAIGLLAGLLVALQPLAVPTVAWIATHQDPLAATFSAAALVAVVESLARRGRAAVALPPVLLFLGLLAKEPAVAAAAVMVVVIWLWGPRPATLASIVRGAWPTVAAVALYLLWRLVLFGGAGGYTVGGESQFLGVREGTAAGVLRELPATLLVPANQAIVAGAETLRLAATALGLLILAAAVRTAARPALALVTVGAVWLLASLVPVHNMLWMGPHLLNARYLYIASLAFALIVAGLIGSALTAVADRRLPVAGLLFVVATLSYAAFIARANLDQWLENASLSGGIAADLVAIDRVEPVGRVEFDGFPPFVNGSYAFNLELLPAIALAREIPVSVRQSDGQVRTAGTTTAPAGVACRYRFVAGSRLWTRDRLPPKQESVILERTFMSVPAGMPRLL